ncbi:MAG: 30S ribosomal protein THX [Cyclobacteriaceae bacterium]
MGKGDIKTKRGKLSNGSYGRLRPKKKSTVAPETKKKTKKKK